MGVRLLLEPSGRSAAEDLSEALIWSFGDREERAQTRGEISVSAKVLSSCRPFQASAWTSGLGSRSGGGERTIDGARASKAQAAALRSSI